MKSWKLEQKEGYKGLTGLEREKPWKIWVKNDKKSSVEPCQSVWISQNTVFKKLDSRCSIDRKTSSINRTKQRLTEFFKQDFDWSKIRLDQSKFWKKQLFRKKNLIFWKHTSKHWIWEIKMHEYKMKCSSKTQVLNPIFPRI